MTALTGADRPFTKEVSMKYQCPLPAAIDSRLKPSAQELMAAARQARAKALHSMISALGRRLRSLIAIPRLSAKDRAAADASAGALKPRPDS